MSNLQENKGFKYGFKLGIIWSFLAQLVTFNNYFASAKLSPDDVMHQVWNIGFPFTMYSGWFLILSDGEMNYYGLIANLLFAILFSITLGLIFKFKNQLYKFFKNTAFNIGFVLGIVMFLFLQYYDHLRNVWWEEKLYQLSKEGLSIDIIWSWGLPFPMYYWGQIFLIGIIGNIVVAIIFSFILGLIFKFVWSKIAAQSN